MDNSTLALLGVYHGQANPDRILIADIDTLITIAEKFEERYGDTDWEESSIDWADTVALYYNDMRDKNWDKIQTVNDDLYMLVKVGLGQYLSNDLSEHDDIIVKLKNALKKKKTADALIDYIDGVEVWEKVEYQFTVREFCKLIGLTNK